MALALPLALGILTATVISSAEEPAARTSAPPTTPLSTPTATSSDAGASHAATPPAAPTATPGTASASAAAPAAPESAEPPAESTPAAPPPAEKKGGRAGYVAGGLVSLAIGVPVMIVGGALLSVKGPSGSCGGYGCLDFSPLDHIAGGISLGLGAAGALAGTILLGVAIGRSGSSPEEQSRTAAVPVITLGVGQASARWSF